MTFTVDFCPSLMIECAFLLPLRLVRQSALSRPPILALELLATQTLVSHLYLDISECSLEIDRGKALLTYGAYPERLSSFEIAEGRI